MRAERHHRHERARERADGFVAEHRRDPQRGGAAAHLQRHLAGPAGVRARGERVPGPGWYPDRGGARLAEADRARREGRERERFGEAVEHREARVGAGEIDRRVPAVGGAHRRGLLQQRGGLLDPGQALDAREQVFVEALAAARAQLQAGGTR